MNIKCLKDEEIGLLNMNSIKLENITFQDIRYTIFKNSLSKTQSDNNNFILAIKRDNDLSYCKTN